MKGVKAIHVIQVLNKTGLQNNTKLVDDFFKLYEDKANFPDEGECEEPEKIKERIREMPINPTVDEILDNKPDPYTHLLCLELELSDNRRELAAGCIVEYYPISACALVTYIFVSTKWRGEEIKDDPKEKGLAEFLLTDDNTGLPSLIKHFNTTYASKTTDGKVVKAVFFESNNPLKTEKDSMPPHKRLKFFKRLGAKRVEFQYVQPPIGEGKSPVSNLFLLTFPKYSETGPMFIPVLTIIRFVLELAKSLDKNQKKKEDNTENKDLEEDTPSG